MLRALVYFVLFFFGFFTSEYIRFQYGTGAVVYLLSAVSGISFFVGLKKLKLLDASWSIQALLGAAFGLVWFGMIFLAEDRFNKNKLTQSFNLDQFSELTEHCGIKIGGRIAYSFKPPIDAWKVSIKCRIEHWKLLDKTKNICDQNFNCTLGIMQKFGANGYGSNDDRKFFFQYLKEAQKTLSSIDGRVRFLQIDQQFVKNRKPLHEQIGSVEQFSSAFAVFQLEDEIATIEQTQVVLEYLEELLPVPTDDLKPVVSELKIQIEKLSQLRADLEFLKKKN